MVRNKLVLSALALGIAGTSFGQLPVSETVEKKCST